MAKTMTHDPHPFHIVGECQDCCSTSEALRMGYHDEPMGPMMCETPGCVNYEGDPPPVRAPEPETTP